jgi:hypothetical protein
MPPLDAAALLAAYDEQLRAYVPPALSEGEQLERDGPLLRFFGDAGQGWVLYRDLGGLDGEALDALIRRQVAFFSARGQRFEWKYHAHDLPLELPDHLISAGLIAEEQETVLIGAIDRLVGTPALPEGVTLREVSARADIDRIAAMEGEVWSEDHAELAEFLQREVGADPDRIRIVVAEAEARVVCAAWVRFPVGTELATLWGGATLAAWRGRGIYRATVTYRANLAASRGYRFLEVDASDDSRPILERLGFIAVTTTTPYVWFPAAGRSPLRISPRAAAVEHPMSGGG